MRAIQHYGLHVGINDVTIPDAPFEIIGVGIESGVPVVWLEVDTSVTERAQVHFRVIKTGEVVTRDRNFSRFVGTIPQGAFLADSWHVLYEEL